MPLSTRGNMTKVELVKLFSKVVLHFLCTLLLDQVPVFPASCALFEEAVQCYQEAWDVTVQGFNHLLKGCVRGVQVAGKVNHSRVSLLWATLSSIMV